MKLLFDIETDGLYFELTRIHCVAIKNLDSGETLVYNDEGDLESITCAITLLDSADWLIGHNIIGYDIPVIQKFFPFFNPKGKAIDTLLLSRLRYPNMLWKDSNEKRIPSKMFGRHSLESWGHRLQCLKGEFGKTTDWTHWSQELQDYMVQDTAVTATLWDHFHQSYPGLP